jgi:hypothetical protein
LAGNQSPASAIFVEFKNIRAKFGSVHRWITKPVDWLAIELARLAVPMSASRPGNEAEVREMAEHPDFFCDFAQPAELRFVSPSEFIFPSQIQTRWEENNWVRGHFYPASVDWRKRSTTILLHGWNGDLAYRYFFPRLARRLTRRGINAAMIELPYHARRKPSRKEEKFNFISGDLLRMVEAIRQGIADIRALTAWFKTQSPAPAGLWGYSMGGWFAGLAVCCEARLDFAVLQCPVAQMDRVVQELSFCRPLKESLARCPLTFERINLSQTRPCISPDRVLLVQSRHDLFAPADTIEEVWKNWGHPQIWRLPQGHISVMASSRTLEAISDWIAEQK